MEEVFTSTGYLLALAVGIGISLLAGIPYLALSSTGEARRNAMVMLGALPLSVLVFWFVLGLFAVLVGAMLPND